MSLRFESNPAAYGCINAFMDGRKRAVGGLSNTNRVRGYFLAELIYEGDDEQEAMQAIEEKYNALSLNIRRALQD
jgi:hypothetical protein